VLAAAVIAGPQPPSKIHALIVTGQNGHDWRATTPVLRKLLEDTGRFEVRVSDEFRGAGPETLAPYDVVILNYYDSNRPELRWASAPMPHCPISCVPARAWAVYHFSTAAFNGWQEYEKHRTDQNTAQTLLLQNLSILSSRRRPMPFGRLYPPPNPNTAGLRASHPNGINGTGQSARRWCTIRPDNAVCNGGVGSP